MVILGSDLVTVFRVLVPLILFKCGVVLATGHQVGPGAWHLALVENSASRTPVRVHGPATDRIGDALVEHGAVTRLAEVAVTCADRMRHQRRARCRRRRRGSRDDRGRLKKTAKQGVLVFLISSTHYRFRNETSLTDGTQLSVEGASCWGTDNIGQCGVVLRTGNFALQWQSEWSWWRARERQRWRAQEQRWWKAQERPWW